MDLTFQVPMQYCSLQHQTLLPSPVTSTTGHCFCFGSASSFFSGPIALHSFPVAYWTSSYLGGSSSGVISLCYHTVHGVLAAKILEWLLSELSTITHPSWVTLHGMAHSFIDYKGPFNTTRLLSMKGRYLLLLLLLLLSCFSRV